MIDNMDRARDAMLGPEELRTADKPVEVTKGVFTGGTAFERDNRAKPLEAGIRCYTQALSLEKQNSIVAPCAASKLMGDVDPHLVTRRQVIMVSLIIVLTN